MKTVLTGINSKYIHTCLAIWYLKASVTQLDGGAEVIAREFTINDNRDNILSEIYGEKPDILAFSCYIWNIGLVLCLAAELKKLLPYCQIILGGPEVSYHPEEVLKENSCVDFVLSGEGEESFPVLYNSLRKGLEDYRSLKGIAYRDGNSIVHNRGFQLVDRLDDIPSPYLPEMMATVSNRIVYYESSRGCPFSCSYCISSTFHGVRFFSFERIRKDISAILHYQPKLVKFVDRTFNCNKKRAGEIFEYLMALDTDTVFHFEMAGDLLDEELLDMLGRARKGLFQFEIGIQTTNAKTLEEIDRVTDLEKLKKNVGKIISNGNIHVHLDLIAGLPYEDWNSFRASFNDVYQLRPHQLQLGFLKLLKGSRIRNEAQKHQYAYRSYAPYEILKNDCMSFDQIIILKDVEEVLERYFNSGRFSESLEYMLESLFETPFEMFGRLAEFCRKGGYLDRPVSYRENISILLGFFSSCSADAVQEAMEIFRQNMVFDFLSSDSSGSVPDCLKREKDWVSAEVVHQILRNDQFVQAELPEFLNVPVKNMLKKVYFVKLDAITQKDEVTMFNYTKKDGMKGTFQSTVLKG